MRAEGMPFHPHPELFLQLGGQTHFRFPRGRLTLRTHHLCIVPTGVPHGETALDGREPFRTLVLICMANSLGCIYGQSGSNRIPSPEALRSFAPVDPLLVSGLLKQARRLAREKGRERDAGLVTGTLLDVMLSSLDHPLPTGHHASWSLLVRRCHELAQQRFSSISCNVAWLARELGCTPNYLSLKFSRETGKTLTAFIQGLRLQQACGLLETSNLNIIEIAQACGYGNSSYLISRFRRAYGLTPRQYRSASR
ncbi:MAG: helix-turn-helix domain-containing protein [Kiritimatiellia bacterium]